MTPPKSTPDRKGKVCKPDVIDVSTSFSLQLEMYPPTNGILFEYDTNLDIKDESKTTQED